MGDAVPATRFDGLDSDTLAARLGLPTVDLYASVSSTMDIAHQLAREGAAPLTLVLADEQTSGRGRGGKQWTSIAGAGLWTTFVLRPEDAASVGVLSLRVGLVLARRFDELAGARIRLKWPNDLFIGEAKLAGVLAEARWRERTPEWVALGIGINIRPPHLVADAAGFPADVSRLDVLAACVAGVKELAALAGPLSESERAEYASRDLARDRACSRPRPGVVAGIAADGALLIRDGDQLHSVYAGSLRFAEN